MASTTVGVQPVQQPPRLRNFWASCRLLFGLFKSVLALPFQRKIELRDPQPVLAQKLGDELQVLDFATDKLTSFGDNYSSSIVKLVVDVKRQPTGPSERLDLVAKMLPPLDFARKQMHAHDILAKEIFFYDQIVPVYDQLGAGDLDITPRFYGGRLTSTEAAFDESAVLLLENLKEKGYALADRSKGLTWDHLKLALPAIAKFHARGLAIKQKLPECYSKIESQARLPLVFPAQMLNLMVSSLTKLVKNNPELSEYHERVESLLKLDAEANCSIFECVDSEHPYACLTHRDLWINNVMFHSSQGRPDAFKILDFQLYNISSPMVDLLYFLFTSLPRSFDGFDDAVELYRQCMRDTLAELQCDRSLFEPQAFERQLKEDARMEMYRCLLMTKGVELRSAWDFVRNSADQVRRLKGILRVYESKGWFDN